ncbi:U4/U5/U6 small nuclear ribonucleoprotein prp3 [Candida viswanathii]|uniref:U4/U5/U6 small nuclear ribonucleoprotein prp3 n=1 Tax=Candida viswanathii TaxID=5486 RepID=A0A367XRT7_9ASCO|nr:U4/U5/U6 small nuclear ribonucleoprotein prp3 [Candida viswanathii]
MKRAITEEADERRTKPKPQTPQDKINAAKERIKKLQQQQQQQTQTQSPKGFNSGLDVEIHPLLKNIGTTPQLPKNHNPVKQASRKKWFDPAALNPYVNQSDITKKHTRVLRFNKQGKFIAQGDKLREKLRIEAEEKRKLDEIKQQGLLPDQNLGEELYKPEQPPLIEWWDRPYLKDNNYSRIDDESRMVLDNEDQPVTSYIQHPTFVSPSDDNDNQMKPMYLTKKERKRMRRNDRQIRHQEKQDRIKLGLDPPPPPKVKLSNLMNVLTNEAIKDPTSVEKRVKQEMQQRIDKHMAENEARKLTKEEKHEKIWKKQDKDLHNGVYSTIYKVDRLSNPKHLFKLDIGAKEENLFGICLKNPRFNLIIVEGGEKAIGQYKKLMTNRIKWTQEPLQGVAEDLSQNKCEVVWEGSIPELHFQKWSIMHSRNDDEAINVLKKFHLEKYWRLVNSL